MAGDVTIGFLKRLSHVDGSEGELIAGQPYWDVDFTGGTISGVTFSDIILGLTRRVVTAAGSVTVSASDCVVIINKTVGAATSVSLPALTSTSQQIFYIKDGKGDAGTNNITVTPVSGTVDGQANFVLNNDYMSITVIWNGTGYNVL